MPVECSSFRDVEVCRCGTLVGGKVFYWANFYRIGDLLIDAGCPNAASEVVETVGRVGAVLITHHHEDHVGAAPLLSSSAKVYAPFKALDLLSNPPRIPEYRRIVWGQPSPFKASPLPGKLRLGGLDVRVLETPGHSFDHVCFLIGEYLFSGDLVLPPRQMVAMRGEDYSETIRSLERIVELDFEYALGGVGIYAKDEVEEYLNYLKRLRRRATELYSQGMSVEEIVAKLFPNPPSKVLLMEEFSGGEWSRANFVRSLLGLGCLGSP